MVPLEMLELLISPIGVFKQVLEKLNATFGLGFTDRVCIALSTQPLVPLAKSFTV